MACAFEYTYAAFLFEYACVYLLLQDGPLASVLHGMARLLLGLCFKALVSSIEGQGFSLACAPSSSVEFCGSCVDAMGLLLLVHACYDGSV